MKLKTLHLTNSWHATSGGIGIFYRSLLAAANRTGHALRLVVPSEHDELEEVGAWGRIYHVRSARAPLNHSYRLLYPPSYLRRGGPIREILNAERPDLIEICDKYTLPYLGGLLRIGKLDGVSSRVPVVGLSCERMDENLAAYLGRSRIGSRFCRWYMKNIYFPQFDEHVANSAHTAEELREAARGHKVQRGVWIRPMGVDCSCFSPGLRDEKLRAQMTERAGGNTSSILLLYAGRLVPEKNLDLLADVLAELRQRRGTDFRFVIAGEGMSKISLAAAFERRAAGGALFLDHIVNRGELARLFASCDVFVHPNPREPFGIAPLEAMASGLPLVAPNVGGITSYANASNAFLAAPDALGFANAIETVAHDPMSKARRCAAALMTAAQYDWPQIASQFLELYRDLALSFQQGREPASRPHFYSTPGDRWGREIRNQSNISWTRFQRP